MDIKELRVEIDRIDSELTALFKKRMEIAAGVAKYKKENAMPVFDRERERAVLNSVTEKMPEELQVYTKTLYQTIFDLSRSYQKKLIFPESGLSKLIGDVIAKKIKPDIAKAQIDKTIVSIPI